MKVLLYSKWSNFRKVIDKAKASCKLSSGNIQEHFAEVGKLLTVGNDAKIEVLGLSFNSLCLLFNCSKW